MGRWCIEEIVDNGGAGERVVLPENKRPYLGGNLDKPSGHQRMLGLLLVVFSRTNFHFLNDGSGRML